MYIVGTMCYLAPERLRAHFGSELKKADVWAVGMFYHVYLLFVFWDVFHSLYCVWSFFFLRSQHVIVHDPLVLVVLTSLDETSWPQFK